MIDSTLLLAALIVGVTALAFWLDRRFTLLSKVGASLLAIVFGATLSNTGIVPASAPIYSAVTGPVTMLAIAWLLLAVNLSDLKKAGPRMLTAFGVALLGTALGASVGGLLFSTTFGDQAWRLSATLTGTFSGGSLNFVAVASAVDLSEEILAGTVAADNVMTAAWLAATLTLPIWLGRFYPTPIPTVSAEEAAVDAEHPFFHREPLSTLDLSILMAVGLGLVVLAEWFAGFWIGLGLPSVPAILWLTTFALLVGHLTPMRHGRGAFQLGNLALHLFFVVIGIFSRFSEIVEVGPAVFLFVALVVVTHGIVVYGLGRLLKLDVATLSVASQAAIGGPSSALAVAVSREWRALLLPGVIVGLLGYAIGTYIGLSVGWLVRVAGS
ncbi:MAG: DUF819 family protein [Longimicrobiales bacterium]|nr:DUF819 family protein [Longimicrobiales bacterium]